MKLFTPVVQSVSTDQTVLLGDIMHLRGIERFGADVTYGNGGFYGDIPEPELKFDIDPLAADVTEADSSNLPLPDASLDSMVFDPPFLTYIKQGREHGSVMANRFGGYWSYAELTEHYQRTLQEAGRVISHKGTLVLKCQDIIHNHKLHATHINVVGWADEWFRLADLFILTAANRMPAGKGTQQHARIHHSYFLVMERR